MSLPSLPSWIPFSIGFGMLHVFIVSAQTLSKLRTDSRIRVDRTLLRALGLGLSLRVVAAFLIPALLFAVQDAPFLDPNGASDDWAYHREAVNVMQGWLQGTPYEIPHILSAYTGYIYFCAFLYYVFWPSTIVARLGNAVVGTILIVHVYKIARHYGSEKTASRAAILTAVFPNLVIFSSLQYRDTIIAFIVVFGVWTLIRIVHHSRWEYLPGFVFCLFAMSHLRSQFMYGLILVAVLYFVLSLFNRGVLPMPSSEAAVIALSLAVVATGVVFVSVLDVDVFQFDRFAEFRSSSIQKFGLPPAAEQVMTHPLMILVELVMIVILPIPTFVLGDFALLSLLTTPGRVVWFLLLPFAAYGLYGLLAEDFIDSFPLYAFTGGTILGMFVMFELFGLRKLVAIMPFFIIFASLGLERSDRSDSWYHLYLLAIATVILGYNLFRAWVL